MGKREKHAKKQRDADEVEDGADSSEDVTQKVGPAPKPRKRRQPEGSAAGEDGAPAASDVVDGGDGGDARAHTGKRKRRRKQKDESAAEAAGGEAAAEVHDAGPKADEATVRTVYVEGIPFDATEAQLRDVFKACGTIVDLRMPT